MKEWVHLSMKCGYTYHDAQDQLETSLPFQLVDSVTGKKLTNETASLQVPSSSLVDFHIFKYLFSHHSRTDGGDPPPHYFSNYVPTVYQNI
jgi:hypothetical protein